MPHGPIFISPSVTTYGKVNPGFRVYHLEPRTFRLLDYEQYYLNITAANGELEMKQNGNQVYFRGVSYIKAVCVTPHCFLARLMDVVKEHQTSLGATSLVSAPLVHADEGHARQQQVVFFWSWA